jgi:AcrR family transcriptional regulator
MPAAAKSTKEQILLAAERLIADHGVDGVSMRQIGADVGSGNNSAVLYHFGSKQELVRAIFEYRLPRLRERRAQLIAERQPADLRGWLECQICAVLEQSELDNSTYMSFVASLSQHGGEAFKYQPKRFVRAQREYEEQLRACLTSVEEPLRSHRLAQVMGFVVQAGAHREQARARRWPVLPFTLELANLVDCMVAFLEAPLSVASRTALEQTDANVFHRTLFV